MFWDRPCDLCGGAVKWVNVPNKVWTQFGFGDRFVCVPCMIRTLDSSIVIPANANDVTILGNEVIKQKDKFGLKDHNQFFNALLPIKYGVAQAFSVDLPTTYSVGEFFHQKPLSPKTYVVHAIPWHDCPIYVMPKIRSEQCDEIGWRACKVADCTDAPERINTKGQHGFDLNDGVLWFYSASFAAHMNKAFGTNRKIVPIQDDPEVKELTFDQVTGYKISSGRLRNVA